jgi:hypothetical protein
MGVFLEVVIIERHCEERSDEGRPSKGRDLPSPLGDEARPLCRRHPFGKSGRRPTFGGTGNLNGGS